LNCPWPPRLARPPSAAPQANAGRAWLAGELAMAGGFICNLMLEIWDLLFKKISERLFHSP